MSDNRTNRAEQAERQVICDFHFDGIIDAPFVHNQDKNCINPRPYTSPEARPTECEVKSSAGPDWDEQAIRKIRAQFEDWCNGTRNTWPTDAELAALLRSRVPQGAPLSSNDAFGYAYRYPYGILLGTNGRDVNGCKPIETIPLYTKEQAEAYAARALREKEQEIAALLEVWMRVIARQIAHREAGEAAPACLFRRR